MVVAGARPLAQAAVAARDELNAVNAIPVVEGINLGQNSCQQNVILPGSVSEAP